MKLRSGRTMMELQCLPSPPGRALSLSSTSFLLPSSRSTLHHSLPSAPSTAPASPPPRVGRAMPSSYPSPAVPLLPFFFIKLPRQKSVAGRPWRSTQLSYSTITRRAQLARLPCSFIQSGPTATSRSQWRSIHSDWGYRKTKTENEVPCFVSFIDE